MPLIPQEPFRQLDSFRNQLDRWLHDLPGTLGFGNDISTARIDVYETDTEVVAHCEIPGLTKQEDVQIRVDDMQLTIQGVMLRHEEIREETLHRKERFVGRFQRSVSLPVRVKAEGTTASYRNGVLEVRMPKETAEASRRIDVRFQ
jgi:HSP20 family protein